MNRGCGIERDEHTRMMQIWLVVEPRLCAIAYKKLQSLKILSFASGQLPKYESVDELISEMWVKLKEKEHRGILPEFRNQRHFVSFCRDILHDIARKERQKVANRIGAMRFVPDADAVKKEILNRISSSPQPDDYVLFMDFVQFLRRKDDQAADVALMISIGIDDTKMISGQLGIPERRVYSLRLIIKREIANYNAGRGSE